MAPNPYEAPRAPAPARDPQKPSLLEGLGVVTVALLLVRLVSFSLGDWGAMFRDVGARDDLPWLTRALLMPWSGAALAVPSLASLALAYRSRRQPVVRRRGIAASVLLAFVGLAVCVLAMYLPIFKMARNLRSE